MDIRMVQQYKIIKKQNFYFLIFHLIWFFSPPMGNFFDMQQTLETSVANLSIPCFTYNRIKQTRSSDGPQAATEVDW